MNGLAKPIFPSDEGNQATEVSLNLNKALHIVGILIDTGHAELSDKFVHTLVQRLDIPKGAQGNNMPEGALVPFEPQEEPNPAEQPELLSLTDVVEIRDILSKSDTPKLAEDFVEHLGLQDQPELTPPLIKNGQGLIQHFEDQANVLTTPNLVGNNIRSIGEVVVGNIPSINVVDMPIITNLPNPNDVEQPIKI